MSGIMGLLGDIKEDLSAGKLLFPRDITPPSLPNNHNKSKARLFTSVYSTLWE